jgi:hypothetical protein
MIRLRKYAALFAIVAILVGVFAFAGVSARPVDCYWVCGPVPFPPGYACWHVCY